MITQWYRMSTNGMFSLSILFHSSSLVVVSDSDDRSDGGDCRLLFLFVFIFSRFFSCHCLLFLLLNNSRHYGSWLLIGEVSLEGECNDTTTVPHSFPYLISKFGSGRRGGLHVFDLLVFLFLCSVSLISNHFSLSLLADLKRGVNGGRGEGGTDSLGSIVDDCLLSVCRSNRGNDHGSSDLLLQSRESITFYRTTSIYRTLTVVITAAGPTGAT